MADGTRRQMALVGFMQAGNATVYAGSWRHPATEHGFLTAGYYEKLGRTLEEGCFDLMFFDDRLAMPGIYGGSVAEAVRNGARPVKLDLSIVLGIVAGVDPLHRPRRHVLHDLLLAVPRGPHLRHAGPPVRRPSGLERRHIRERQRGAELRRRRSTSPTTPATTGPTSSSRRRPACGTAGRTTRWCSTGDPALRRPRQGARARPRGRVVRRARPADRAPRPAGTAAPLQAGSSGRGGSSRPSWAELIFTGDPGSTSPGALQGPEGEDRRARARPGLGQDAAPWPTRWWASQRPTPRSASSCSSTIWSTPWHR